MAITRGLNPDVVKTALDDIFVQEYDFRGRPEVATAESTELFKQVQSDRSAEIMETMQDGGLWKQTGELQPLSEGTVRTGNKQTYEIKKWTMSLPISTELFDDDLHNVVGESIRKAAMKARVTRDKYAMSLWADAQSGTLFTTGDGVALESNSHVNLNGDTVDNLITGALSPSTLDTAITTLNEQIDEAGDAVGLEPHCLLVSRANFKTACEILDSEYEAFTAENQENVYSSKYGIYLKASHWLNTNQGGNDAQWHLLSRHHSVMRFIRQNVETDLVPPEYSANDAYIYKGRFREEVGAQSYFGVVGSTGV